MTYAIMAYNHTIHSATGLTPFEVTFGHTDSGKIFDINVEKSYTQQLVSDHAKRTKYLYKHLAERMLQNKEKTRERKGGEPPLDLTNEGTIYVKDVNTRKSKDKPRYHKATVQGKTKKNIVPVKIGHRKTNVHLKNVKRPPQVVEDHRDPEPVDHDPGPSTSKDRK